MDNSISDLLSNYCDQLIGIATEDKSKKKKEKKKNSHSVISKNDVIEECKSNLCNSEKVEKVEKEKIKSKTDKNHIMNNNSFPEQKNNGKTKKAKILASLKHKTVEDIHVVNGNRVTNDGFKVVTGIPSDDSDISDAFESDQEEEFENISKPINVENYQGDGKLTDDGFKIRYEDELPRDDSDISDAFTESEDEKIQVERNRKTEDGFKIKYEDELKPDDSDISDAFSEDDEEFGHNDKEIQNSKSKGKSDRSRKVNKLLQGMIDDFGIDENALHVKKNNNQKKQSVYQGSTKTTKANKLTLAAKQKSSSEVTVIDYTEKRGGVRKEKKTIVEEEIPTEDKVDKNLELSDERQFKRARFEVFKFGMGGFNKEKKQDARVALAIKLGAKPPKKKAINYKDLQVQKKDEQIQKQDERESKRRMGLQVKKPSTKKRIRDTNRVGDFDTQIGRFDGGVVRLSKSDIAKIKRKK